MRYRVFGDKLPGLTLQLDAGESIYTQSGGMSWMSDNFQMDTNVRGGLMKGLGRMLTGESLFMATYTARSEAKPIHAPVAKFSLPFLPSTKSTGPSKV